MKYIEQKLNSFNAKERAGALCETVRNTTVFNMHCHSFFSYNGYGFSPTTLAVLAKQSNWRAVGLVDFDVLDGVDEFLNAAKALGVKASAGMETRVFIPELAKHEINSPGEPGIAYHLGFGFKSSQIPETARPFAEELRMTANHRTRKLMDLVNAFLPETALDFNEVACKFTPAGNVTERHVCLAYREKAEELFRDCDELAKYWCGKLGSFEPDQVKLEALIRSKTMKKGGVGYVEPKPESFPSISDMNAFVKACGAVPTVAWLNGFSAGEADPGKLLDLHMKYGAEAVTLIPDRNWNVPDPEKRVKLTTELDRFIAACEERNLPILAGTEMNAPGQLLADDFTVPALAKHVDIFIKGADAFAE